MMNSSVVGNSAKPIPEPVIPVKGISLPNPAFKADNPKETPCEKHKEDALSCVSCEAKCPAGVQAVKLLDKQTRSRSAMFSGRDAYNTQKRINAMQAYIDASVSPDRYKFLMEKFGISKQQAIIKYNGWKHNYGTDYNGITTEITRLKAQLAASDVQTNKRSSELPDEILESVSKSPTRSVGQTRIRRQDEKLTQACLEHTRRELEEQILSAEANIEHYKKAIEEAEHTIEEVTAKIQAIRQVLEIFKKKDELYV